jgi:hypothetical protein
VKLCGLKEKFYNFTLVKYLIIWRRSCVFQVVQIRKNRSFFIFLHKNVALIKKMSIFAVRLGEIPTEQSNGGCSSVG